MNETANSVSNHSPLPESESMACNESDSVNVGDPGRSYKDVSINRQV